MANRERSIVLRIAARSDGSVKRVLGEASTALNKTARESKSAGSRIAQSVRDNEQAFTTAGTALVGFGAATTLALGASAKAAIDWETAFTGVRKTVNGSDADFKALEDGIRGLSKELPTSANEIAAVAEAAGQLGIQTPNILDFSKTMVNLGETTNLSAGEAATAIARFANVMGTSQTEFDNIGSAIVGLGNNFATTEAEIVGMASRLSGAGRQAGLTEGEVLGLATALSSVGIEAEAGGTAFSRVLIDMGTAVDTGSESLGVFARVSGLTSAQFAEQWSTDSGGAVSAFIEGLGSMESSGQSIQPILAELGLTDIRVGDALRRSASASDLFSDAMAQGNKDYSENVALTKEAETRYGTVASQLGIAKNAIVDAGVSLGEVFLPAIVATAEGAAGLAGLVGDLPEPLLKVVGGLSGIAGVGALAAGGLLLVAPRAVDTYDAFKRLSDISPKLSGKLKGVGKVAGVVAGLAALTTVVGSITNASQDATLTLEELNNLLVTKLPGSVDVAGDTFGDLFDDGMIQRGEGFRDLLDGITDPGRISRFGAGVESVFDVLVDTDSNAEKTVKRFAEIGDQLGALYSSDLPAARDAFREFYDEAGGDQEGGLLLLEVMPGLRSELASMATEMGLTADEATLLKIATGEIVPPTEKAAAAATDYEAEMAAAEQTAQDFADANDALRESIESAGAGLLGARGAARAYEESLDAVKAALKSNGKTLDTNTEKGRNNQQTLDDVAQSTLDYATAAFDAGSSTGELTAIMESGRAEFIKSATQLGLTKAEASALADAMGLIPEDVALNVQANGLSDVRGDIDSTVDYAGDQEAFISYGANPEDARRVFRELLADVNTSVGTSKFDLNPGPAETILYNQFRNIRRTTGTSKFDLNPKPAESILYSQMRTIGRTTGTSKLDLDNDPATGVLDKFDTKVTGTTSTMKMDMDTDDAKDDFRTFVKDSNGKTIRVNFANGTAMMASGGTVQGQFINSTADNVLARLTPKEFVTRVDSAERMRRENPGALEHINRTGTLPQFAGGGSVSGNPDWRGTFDVDWMEGVLGGVGKRGIAAAQKSYMDAGGGPKATGGLNALRPLAAQFGVPITSGYRPGARTATGYLSKHGQGKAMDTGLSKRFWDYLEAQKGRWSELYGPWGLWNKGLPRSRFPGADTVRRIHQDHIHVATYGDGGTVQGDLHPGEHVLSKSDVSAMGGHDSIYAQRRAALGGRDNSFAIGGAVGQTYGQRQAALSPSGASGGPQMGELVTLLRERLSSPTIGEVKLGQMENRQDTLDQLVMVMRGLSRGSLQERTSFHA